MKLLFLTTEDSTFYTHRLALARAAQRAGAEVVIMVRPGQCYERLEREGLRLIPWTISRRSLNPVRELRSLMQVVKLYRREQPDIVHHVALKPILYGSLAARISGRIATVNSVTGLGPIFTTPTFFYALLRRLLVRLLRFSLAPANSLLVTQNDQDRELLNQLRVAEPHRTFVILGFGSDTNTFRAGPPDPSEPAIVVLPARMLWEKGIREFVEAAAHLRKRAVPVRMVLAGAPDKNNPGCIPAAALRAWAESGIIEWWGHCNDIKQVLVASHIVCLPSYREGLPRVLVEAASCSRPIVATDVPGCSAVVQHGVNGLLVPPGDSRALADALQSLICDRQRVHDMGLAARTLALQRFSEKEILSEIFAVYDKLLAGKWHFNKQRVKEELRLAVGQ